MRSRKESVWEGDGDEDAERERLRKEKKGIKKA